MKRILSIIFTISLAIAGENIVPDTLITALIAVESGGNPAVIGDNGKAVGVLQIWEVVLQDVNRVYKTNYLPDDRKNPEKSKEICRLYLSHYGSEKRLTHKATNEELARIWNGGPNGHKKEATKGYWIRVQKVLNG